MNKKLIFIASSILLSTNIFAGMLDVILPHYVQVDKSIPLYEYQMTTHTIETCEFSQYRVETTCTENVKKFKKYISGLDASQISEYYEKHLDTVYYDENTDSCFKYDEEKVCSMKEQKDYLPVIYAYKNIAWSKGKTYEKYSKEPLDYIDIRKGYYIY